MVTYGPVRVRIGNGGWIEYRDGPFSRVILRLQPVNGRLRVTEVYLAAEQGLSARALRTLPLGEIEAFTNAPDIRPHIEARLDLVDQIDLGTVAAKYGTTYGRPPTQRRAKPSPILSIPKKRPYPDQFFEAVARAYTVLAREGRSPAKSIADANDVPVGRVHGWIREARSRGLLGPPRPGTRG